MPPLALDELFTEKASRLADAALDDKPDPAAAATIARAALADFPDDVNVLWLALEFG